MWSRRGSSPVVSQSRPTRILSSREPSTGRREDGSRTSTQAGDSASAETAGGGGLSSFLSFISYDGAGAEGSSEMVSSRGGGLSSFFSFISYAGGSAGRGTTG